MKMQENQYKKQGKHRKTQQTEIQKNSPTVKKKNQTDLEAHSACLATFVHRNFIDNHFANAEKMLEVIGACHALCRSCTVREPLSLFQPTKIVPGHSRRSRRPGIIKFNPKQTSLVFHVACLSNSCNERVQKFHTIAECLESNSLQT